MELYTSCPPGANTVIKTVQKALGCRRHGMKLFLTRNPHESIFIRVTDNHLYYRQTRNLIQIFA